MTVYPAIVTVGSVGGTPVQVDVSQGLGSAVAVKVLLSVNYTLAWPNPPGYPTRPTYAGAEVSKINSTISAGTVFAFTAAEAAALVNGGYGTYA